MKWTKPDFEEINLSGEVTAYVNLDDNVRAAEQYLAQHETESAATETLQEVSA